MAAKLLHSLADDNPDIQKQLGCMNGILQIFDRPNIGRRHKGDLHSGISHFNSASLDSDSSNSNDQGSMVEKIGEKDTTSKQVPKPSLPPLDYGKVRDPGLTQPLASPKLGRLSLDLRDIVKDSMHRESRVSNHKGDSPRPLRMSKSFNDRNNNDLPGDLKESLKLLARLKDSVPTTKDASKNSNQKIKDLPRLSLDSRESSMRASTCDFNLSYLSSSFEDEDDWLNQRATCTSKISRPPSVVAKLMGLETLPETKTTKVAFDGSPRWKNPIEPAPWKYLESGHSPQNPVLKQLRSPERLKDLEFKRSGKDLRALKQILEAMEAKGLLGKEKEEQKACKSQKKRAQDSDNAVHGSYSVNRRPNKNQTYKDNTASTSSTYRLSSNRNQKVVQTQNSAKAHSTSKNSNLSSFKSSGSTSPRLPKKLEFDKKSIPPTPDSAKSRRRTNQKLAEASGGSTGGRRRLKPRNETEATANTRSIKTSQCQIIPNEGFKYSDISEIRTSAVRRLNEGEMLEELRSVGPEHPSPISVLDALEYGEDSPSPVKHTSHCLEGIEAKISENVIENEWHSEDIIVGFTSEVKIKQPIMTFEELRQQNSNPNEAKNSNPVNRYVLEILSASGILHTDLNSTFQLNQSGHIINPELFFVLEQTKPNNSHLTKLDRKLTFDAVNEILASKLAFTRPLSEPWLSSSKLTKKSLNAQKLIREICEEIEQLGTIERQSSSDEWTDDFNISSVVLEVERSIFRNLVDEVVMGEAVKRLF